MGKQSGQAKSRQNQLTQAVKPYLDNRVPLAIAHRGFSRDGLENSLLAFKNAQELGYQYLETDINTTADGVTVVFHDASLDRTTDKVGVIAELPFAVVSQARIGGREGIATLREFFQALPNARFNIDVKDQGSENALVELMEEFGLHERVCVASFSDKRRRRVLSRLTKPVTSSPGKGLLIKYFLLFRFLPLRAVQALMRDADVLQIPVTFKGLKIVTKNSVARAHKQGLKVHVWTINDASEMHKLFDLGVDGIMTDRADILADVMRQRGYWS